jgi:hypothetical protein
VPLLRLTSSIFPMDRSTGTHSIAYQRSSSRRIPITRIVKYRTAPCAAFFWREKQLAPSSQL